MGYAAFFIFALFFLLGLLLNAFYQGAPFENGNTIMLEFVALANIPGVMGLITVAIVAAAMSSLDSSLNSMATVTTIDFYQRYLKTNETSLHYLRATRIFTVVWGLLIVGPAIIFAGSDGSVLEVLSKLGSFFVGAKLSMYFLGFYSKHTTERGLLIGVACGFATLWYVEYHMTIAWPWYCAIGGAVSLVVGWISSIALDGFQDDFHPYTVQGQKRLFEENGWDIKKDGWYVVPGKIDPSSYGLLVFFVACLASLASIQYLL
jgi:SSS family solute:Na+ symporter